VSDKLTTAIDLLPTLAGACGIKLKKGPGIVPKLDGLNLWESLQGKTKTHPRSNLLYWHGWAMPQAIRLGDFKLYLDKVKEIPGTNKGPVLIDLSKDPGEEKDLASERPEKVKELKELASKLLSEIGKNSISLGGPVNPKKQSKKGAFWLK
jgi:arylsulfatase A-like enzyme